MPTGRDDQSSISLSRPWVQYTPTITGSTSNPTLSTAKILTGSYVAVGKSLFLSFCYCGGSATGAVVGSGAYLFSMPPGYEIDTAVAILPVSITSSAGDYCGAGNLTLGTGVAGDAVGLGTCTVIAATTTKLAMHSTVCIVAGSGAGAVNTLVGSAAYAITGTNSYFKFTATIPIL